MKLRIDAQWNMYKTIPARTRQFSRAARLSGYAGFTEYYALQAGCFELADFRGQKDLERAVLQHWLRRVRQLPQATKKAA